MTIYIERQASRDVTELRPKASKQVRHSEEAEDEAADDKDDEAVDDEAADGEAAHDEAQKECDKVAESV